MEFRNLEAFLKVAELKHFTQAAHELGYVQSTISSRIQQLEEEIGAPLFERIGKQIILTPAGEELAKYANQIVGLCIEAKEVGREDKFLTGMLRVGTVESLYNSHMSACIPLFRKKFPFVTLSIRMGTGRDLLRRLSKNELDVVLMLDHRPAGQSFVKVFSHPTDVVFVTATENPLCQAPQVTLAEVLRHPLILTERRSLYRDILEEIAEERGLQLFPSLEVNNTSILIQLMKDGMGVSYLPTYSVQRSVNKGTLSILSVVDFEPIKFMIQLVYHKGKWISRPLQTFFNMVMDQVKV